MLENKLDAAWRNYSPGGVRKRMTKIPFNGVVNNDLRAMGTKRVPVVSASFMAQPQIPTYIDPNGQPQYTRPQYDNMAYGYMPQPEQLEAAYENRKPLQTGNRLYRSAIDTSKELRGWKRELDPTRRLLREQRLVMPEIDRIMSDAGRGFYRE